MILHLRSADRDDLDLLAAMNKQLIDDEGSPNPMNLGELKHRMREWLMTSWNVDLLVKDNEVVGYALYQFKENAYYSDRKEVFLRQYLIMKAHRRQGIGLKGIELLMEMRFNDVDTIDIDVLESNRIGKNFWVKAGFIPYIINMRMKR